MDNGQQTTDNRTRTHPTFNFQLSTSAVRRPLTVVRCPLSFVNSSSLSSQLRWQAQVNLDEGCTVWQQRRQWRKHHLAYAVNLHRRKVNLIRIKSTFSRKRSTFLVKTVSPSLRATALQLLSASISSQILLYIYIYINIKFIFDFSPLHFAL